MSKSIADAVFASHVQRLAECESTTPEDIVASSITDHRCYETALSRYRDGAETLQTHRVIFSEPSCMKSAGALNLFAGHIGTAEMWQTAHLAPLEPGEGQEWRAR